MNARVFNYFSVPDLLILIFSEFRRKCKLIRENVFKNFTINLFIQLKNTFVLKLKLYKFVNINIFNYFSVPVLLILIFSEFPLKCISKLYNQSVYITKIYFSKIKII